MRYAVLNLIVLFLIFGFTLIYNKNLFNKKWFLGLAILLVMTAIFDSLIVSSGIVAYTESNYLGIFIGKAPIEDFAYTIAGMMLITYIWNKLGDKSK